MAITQNITALPAAPNRQSDTPDQFSNKADAFVAGQVSMVTEINTWADQANTTQTEINASQAAAAGSATASANSATASAGSATAAQQSADAAAVAAAAAGEDFISTSTTTATLGAGSKTLTVDTGKAYAPGLVVRAVETANPATKYLVGTIISYNSSNGELVFTATSFEGTGSVSAWTVSINTVDAYSKSETDALISESGVGRLFKSAIGDLTASQLVALAEDGSGIEGLENTPTSTGTAQNIATDWSTRNEVCQLTDSKFLFVYSDRDNSSRLYAQVGDIDESDNITFGSAVQITTSSVQTQPRCAGLSSALAVVAYVRDGASYVTALEISENTITLESSYEEQFHTASVGLNCAIDRLTDASFVIAYSGSSATAGRARAGTVDTSANSIMLGAAASYNTGQTDELDVAALTATSFIVSYRDRSSGNDGYSRIGTVASGTTISYSGSETAHNTSGSGTLANRVERLSDTTALVVYLLSNTRIAKVATISGSAISFGSGSLNLGSGGSDSYLAVISQTSAALMYNNDQFVPLSIDGTTVTGGTVSDLQLSTPDMVAVGDRYIAAGASGSTDPNNPRAMVVNPAYDNTSRWLGFSRAAYANGATAEVLKLGDMVSSLSGLAANTTYYIDTATAALTTSNASGIKAGKALDATSLLITGGND